MTQVWRKLVQPFLRYSATDYNLKHLYLSPPPPPSTLPKFNRIEAKMSDFAAFATLQPCNLDIFKVWKVRFCNIFNLCTPRNLDTFQAWKSDSATSATLQLWYLIKLCHKETFGTISSDNIKYSLTSSFLWYTRHPSKPNITGFDAL